MPQLCLAVASLALSTSRPVCVVLLANRLSLVLPYLKWYHTLLSSAVVSKWSRVVQATLNKIPFHGNILCCHLPLSFSWEAYTCPARIGIGFIIADVTDRLSFFYLAQPGEGRHPPTTITLFPVQRRLPLLRTHRVPAF